MKRGTEIYFIYKGEVRKGSVLDTIGNAVRIKSKKSIVREYIFKTHELATKLNLEGK